MLIYLTISCLFLIVFYIDLKFHIIPNRITLPAIVMGWVYAIYLPNYSMIESITATVLGMIILLYPYAKGGVGGGDVKYLASIGSLGGISFLAYTFFWGIMSAFLYSIIFIYKREGINGLKWYAKSIWKPTQSTKNHEYVIPLGSCLSIGGIIVIIGQVW